MAKTSCMPSWSQTAWKQTQTHSVDLSNLPSGKRSFQSSGRELTFWLGRVVHDISVLVPHYGILGCLIWSMFDPCSSGGAKCRSVTKPLPQTSSVPRLSKSFEVQVGWVGQFALRLNSWMYKMHSISTFCELPLRFQLLWSSLIPFDEPLLSLHSLPSKGNYNRCLENQNEMACLPWVLRAL